MSRRKWAAFMAGGFAAAWVARRAFRKRTVVPLTRIVVLGAGLGGHACAAALTRRLGDAVEVTLVDRHNYFLFTPLLAEMVGGEIEAPHVVASLRELARAARFVQGEVVDVDMKDRRVTVAIGETSRRQVLEADHLVFALGSVTNTHDVPGVGEHTLGVKCVSDAVEIRNRALDLLERANAERDRAEQRRLLSFVVVGGGFSGVETMAALNDMVRDVRDAYPDIGPDAIRTTLIHPDRQLLQELGSDLGEYAQRELEGRGVEVVLGRHVKAAARDRVQLDDGRWLDAGLTVWAAGIKPSPVIERLDCRKGRHGGIEVDATCAVRERPNVWALGDCAEVPRPEGGGTYGPTAQNATREGRLVAANIIAAIEGRAPRPFRYRPLGTMAVVGRHRGVASLFGVHISGVAAWLLWRAVYLVKMPGAARRVRVALDWLLDVFFERDLASLSVARPSKAPRALAGRAGG